VKPPGGVSFFFLLSLYHAIRKRSVVARLGFMGVGVVALALGNASRPWLLYL
jgi:hypothetical protein